MKKKEQTTLGERLRLRRNELGFEIRDASFISHVPPHFIEALENNDYHKFSAKVYALGTLEKLLKALTYENETELMKEFSNEWDIITFRTKGEILPLPGNSIVKPYLTPQRIGLAFLLITAILLTIFLGTRLIQFANPPDFILEEPPESIVKSREPTLFLKGAIEKEGRLTVNGREIKVDAVGKFEDRIELTVGVNTLEFLIKDRFDKERREIRYVVVK